jgi:hypothetical protein
MAYWEILEALRQVFIEIVDPPTVMPARNARPLDDVVYSVRKSRGVISARARRNSRKQQSRRREDCYSRSRAVAALSSSPDSSTTTLYNSAAAVRVI